MKAPLVAGILAASAGLLVFLIIHHLWIRPIWFVLPLGSFIGALGGTAVGWAFAELLPHLPARPWTAPALVGLISVILLPSIILAEMREPMFDVSVPGGLLMISRGQAAILFVLELLLTASLAGGLAGWLLGRSTRAGVAAALAGLVFALGPGHNIPFLGGTPGALKGITILLATVAVSAIVLVEAHLRLSVAWD